MFIEVNEALAGGLIHSLAVSAIEEIAPYELLETRRGTFREPFEGYDPQECKPFTGAAITCKSGGVLIVTQTREEIVQKCRQVAITAGS